MAFYRTQTITHKFTLNIDESVIEDFIITYSQNGNQIINKEITDIENGTVEVGDNEILVHLSQDDTALFKVGAVNVQVKIWTKNRKSLISREFLTECKDVLNEKVFV